MIIIKKVNKIIIGAVAIIVVIGLLIFVLTINMRDKNSAVNQFEQDNFIEIQDAFTQHENDEDSDDMLQTTTSDEHELFKNEIREMLDDIIIDEAHDMWGYSEYNIVITNTTSRAFEYFWLNIYFLDDEGNIVGSGSADTINNWNQAQTVTIKAVINGIDSMEGLTVDFSANYQAGLFFE